MRRGGLLLLLSVAKVAGLGTQAGGASVGSFLRAWRTAKIESTANALDPSRYMFQILIVDDDNSRGRVAEGLLERVAAYTDAGWWLYPFSVTTLEGANGQPPPQSVVDCCEELQLCQTRANAPGARLCRADLDSYDLIVALDDDVRTRIMQSLRDEAPADYDMRVRLLSDFLNYETSTEYEAAAARREVSGRSRDDTLDPALADRLYPFAQLFSELPPGGAPLDCMAALPSPGEASLSFDQASGAAILAGGASWRRAEAAMIAGCSGLVLFLKDTIDDGFDAAYDRLLAECFCRREHVDVTWAHAETIIRRHSFTGALDPVERERRFTVHMGKLVERLAQDEQPQAD